MRGFKWNKEALTFEGNAFLGNPEKKHPIKETVALKVHDKACTGKKCATWYVAKNDYIKKLDVTYERTTVLVIGSGA